MEWSLLDKPGVDDLVEYETRHITSQLRRSGVLYLRSVEVWFECGIMRTQPIVEYGSDVGARERERWLAECRQVRDPDNSGSEQRSGDLVALSRTDLHEPKARSVRAARLVVLLLGACFPRRPGRAGISPASSPRKRHWRPSGWSCSRRSRPLSSGARSPMPSATIPVKDFSERRARGQPATEAGGYGRFLAFE
jgi:hypothetical protein